MVQCSLLPHWKRCQTLSLQRVAYLKEHNCSNRLQHKLHRGAIHCRQDLLWETYCDAIYAFELKQLELIIPEGMAWFVLSSKKTIMMLGLYGFGAGLVGGWEI